MVEGEVAWVAPKLLAPAASVSARTVVIGNRTLPASPAMKKSAPNVARGWYANRAQRELELSRTISIIRD